jgi:hypothetical protein
MLKFTFSILFVLISLNGIAQEAVKKDSIPPKTERYGVRFGVDLFKFGKSAFDKNYQGIELVGDYRLTRKYYLAAELGNENKTTNEPQLNFTTKGSYIKAGFDYNAYENWLGMENMIYLGMRYGFSTFSQTLNSYQVYDANQYLGTQPIIVSGEKFDGLNASWLEVVAGIKAEVFQNLFVGFSFRLNYLVSNKKPDNFDNLYVPGFNRTYDGKFGVGFNYTVSYFLPLYKSPVKAKDKVVKKK